MNHVQFNKQPGQRILELGGGANPHFQSDVRVDVRPCQDANGNALVDFTANLEEPLPISSNEFDAVYCQFCLEHISWRKVKLFVSEIARVLKPKGTAIVITANTAAQFEFILKHPNGWDNKDDFESFSCVLFGDQDYSDNTHKSYMDPAIAMRLFQEAGFVVRISPFGEAQTDMIIEATKREDAVDKPAIKDEEGTHILHEEPKSLDDALDAKAKENQKLIGDTPAEQLFNRDYFNGGGKVGGYAAMGLSDFPVHWLTFGHIMKMQPKSLLEIGAARGYIGKRIEDAGIPYLGLEVSKHCVMTRAAKNVIQKDICNYGCWEVSNYDLAFSIAVMEHLPEDLLPNVLNELRVHTKRGLHGIDFGEKDDGFDRTHVTLKSKRWWRQKFDEHGLQSHVIVDKEQLEKGTYPDDLLTGRDSKQIKLNIGCFQTCFHHGWINLDVHDLTQWAQSQQYRFQQCDVRRGLPYATGSVSTIVLIHMLEHLTFPEGLAFLRECRRVIIPETGVMRIQVPDAGLLMGMYSDKQYFSKLADFDEVNEGCANSPTAAGKLWSLLNAGHSAVYDSETLAAILNDAGWEYHPSSFREVLTNSQTLGPERLLGFQMIGRETLDTHPALTLFGNAVAKVG